MNLTSELALHCNVCFQPQPRFIRQCRCFYCELCKGQAVAGCPCGLTGGNFLDLQQCDKQEEALYFTLESTFLLKKLVSEFQEHVLGDVQKVFGTLHRVLTTKERNSALYIQYLETQLMAARREKEELKTQLATQQMRTTAQPPVWRGTTPGREAYGLGALEAMTYRTPAPPMRQIIPRTSDESTKKTTRRPFQHDEFGSFFSGRK